MKGLLGPRRPKDTVRVEGDPCTPHRASLATLGPPELTLGEKVATYSVAA